MKPAVGVDVGRPTQVVAGYMGVRSRHYPHKMRRLPLLFSA